jgi:hypothetical protein
VRAAQVAEARGFKKDGPHALQGVHVLATSHKKQNLANARERSQNLFCDAFANKACEASEQHNARLQRTLDGQHLAAKCWRCFELGLKTH